MRLDTENQAAARVGSTRLIGIAEPSRSLAIAQLDPNDRGVDLGGVLHRIPRHAPAGRDRGGALEAVRAAGWTLEADAAIERGQRRRVDDRRLAGDLGDVLQLVADQADQQRAAEAR